MRGFILLSILALLMAIQAPLLHAMNLSGYAMDLALLGTLYFAASSSVFAGLILSSLVGLVQDAFTPGALLGMNMEIMVILFLVARGLSLRFHLQNPLPLMIAVLVCSIIKAILFFLLSILFDRSFGDYAPLLVEAIPHAVITAVLGPLVAWLLMTVDRGLKSRSYSGPLLK